MPNIAYKQFTEYPFIDYLEFVSHSNSKTGPVCSNTNPDSTNYLDVA